MGTADDAALHPDLVTAKTELSLARATGLRAIRLSIIWTPGQTEPAQQDLDRLQRTPSPPPT